jgi:hypothetical protein
MAYTPVPYNEILVTSPHTTSSQPSVQKLEKRGISWQKLGEHIVVCVILAVVFDWR